MVAASSTNWFSVLEVFGQEEMDSVAQRASATNTVLAYQSCNVSSPIEIPVTLKVQNKVIPVTAYIIDTHARVTLGCMAH